MGRRRLSSIEDYSRALRNGYGVGEGGDYSPWLRVSDVSSHGVSSKFPGIKVPRTYQFLSGVESNFFLYAENNPHVVDIREQFPLLPVDLVASLAYEAGLKYPTVSENVPSVLTTDFLLTLRYNNETSYLPVSVKTVDDLAEPEVIERLEIERLWWESLGESWKLVTDANIDRMGVRTFSWTGLCE